jgi:hypothetical protein
MKSKLSIFAGLCALALPAVCASPAVSQSNEVKEKAPMYSYIANWQVPRAHWADMAKDMETTRPILEKALADGTIIAYGDDENVVHEADGWTHDDWWNATSLAGILKVLDQLASSGGSSSPALESATKHWDEIFVSHYYNWRSGSYKNGYVRVSSYRLKKDAPDNAVDLLAKNVVAPIMEKELAAGNILEYEIDEQFVHTAAPGAFMIAWVCPNAEAVDKANAAVQAAIRSEAWGRSAFGSMTDGSAHRDEFTRGNGTFK